jgi:hypothetical protein
VGVVERHTTYAKILGWEASWIDGTGARQSLYYIDEIVTPYLGTVAQCGGGTNQQ